MGLRLLALFSWYKEPIGDIEVGTYHCGDPVWLLMRCGRVMEGLAGYQIEECRNDAKELLGKKSGARG